MENNALILKIGTVILFIILTLFGILYLLAAPVDASVAVIRIITGVILILVAIVILVIGFLLIQRSKLGIIKTSKSKRSIESRKKYTPAEIVCKNCSNTIELTEALAKKKDVVCEKCGEIIKIPKDSVNW